MSGSDDRERGNELAGLHRFILDGLLGRQLFAEFSDSFASLPFPSLVHRPVLLCGASCLPARPDTEFFRLGMDDGSRCLLRRGTMRFCRCFAEGSGLCLFPSKATESRKGRGVKPVPAILSPVPEVRPKPASGNPRCVLRRAPRRPTGERSWVPVSRPKMLAACRTRRPETECQPARGR
jgi:hypothetical protein